MSKKLLAAALAAAFLATGGVAKAADWDIEGGDGADLVSDLSTLPVGAGAGVGTNTNASTIKGDDSGEQGIGWVIDETVINSSTGSLTVQAGIGDGSKDDGAGGLYVGEDGVFDNRGIVKIEGTEITGSESTGLLLIDDKGIFQNKSASTLILGANSAFGLTDSTGALVTTVAAADGSIVNSGTVQIDAGIYAGAFTAGGLDTGALITDNTAGAGLDYAFKALMNGQAANGTNGAGGIGDVVLTGTLTNDVILRDPDGQPVKFNDQAFAGTVTLRDTVATEYNGLGEGGYFDTDGNDVDVAGATLNVGTVVGSIRDTDAIGAGLFAGRHVNLNEISTAADGGDTGYSGDIIAWGTQAGTMVNGAWVPGNFNENLADGTVTLNAIANDGTRLRVNSDIYAGNLVVQKSAVLTDNAAYVNGGNLRIEGATTVLTNLITNPANMDLTGHDLSGNGVLENSQGAVTIYGKAADNVLTTISDDFVIYNATTGPGGAVAEGEILTDGLGLDTIGQNIKVTTGGASNDIVGGFLGGGFGNIDVMDSNIALTKNGGLIDWRDAQSGTLTWDTSTPTSYQSTFSGTMLLGGGDFVADGDDTKIMTSGSTISALNNIIEDSGLVDNDFIVREGATLEGGLTVTSLNNIDSGKVLNQGTVNIGTNTNDIANVVALEEGSEVINENTMNFGANTEFVGAADDNTRNIDNTDGKIVADANMNGEITNLANAINDRADSVGEIQIFNTMTSTFDVGDAQDGSITLTGNIINGASLDGGEADVVANLSGKTDAGNITGGSVTVNGDDKGNIAGIFSLDGDVNINSSNKTVEAAWATDGDLYVNGSNNTFTTNAVGAIEGADEEGGSVFVKGGSNTFKTTVWGQNDVSVQGNNNIFEDLVISDEGDVLASGQNNTFKETVVSNEGSVVVSGSATFENGVFTDPDLFQALVVTETGTATLGGVIDGNIDAYKNSRIEIGADNKDVELSGTYHADAGSTLEFLRTTNRPHVYSQIHLGDFYDPADGVGGILDWDSDINMYMDGDLARDKNATYDLITGTIHDAEGTAGNVILDGSVASTTDLVNFLNDKGVETFAWDGTYSIDPNDPTKIIYTHRLDSSYDQFLDAMDWQGMGGKEGIVSDNTYDALLNTWSNTTKSDIEALEGLEDGRIGDLAKVLTGIAGQNYWYDLKGNTRAAYAAHQFFNGQDLAGSLEAVQDTVRSFNRAMANRSYALGAFGGEALYDDCGQLVESCAAYKNHIWAGYSGLWGKNSGRGWNDGYKYDAHGINVGFDHQNSSGFGVGAAFGYSKGDYNNYGALSNDSKIQNYDFGVYASYNHCSGFFGTLLGSYTYSKFKMSNRFGDRSLATANTSFSAGFTGWDHAKYHARTWSFGGKIGYDYKVLAGLTITPTLGLYHYRTNTNTFNTSAGRQGMKYSRNITEMPLEVTAKYDINLGNDTMLSLTANAGYAYNFSNKGVSQNAFTVVGDDANIYGGARYQKPGHSSWTVGGGANFRYRMVDFGVNYEYYGRRSYKSHSVNANVGVSF